MEAALEKLREERTEQARLAEEERTQHEAEQKRKMEEREKEHERQMAEIRAKLKEVEAKAKEPKEKVRREKEETARKAAHSDSSHDSSWNPFRSRGEGKKARKEAVEMARTAEDHTDVL
jgi:hypothetical protein